jgi:hypothetical protein
MAVSSLFLAGILSVLLQSAAQSTAEVQKLSDYVSREWPGESHQQSINSTALTLLADAIEARAAQRPSASGALAEDIAKLRQQIEDYRTGKPGDLAQSRRLRRTLVHASSLIERILEAADARRRPRDARLNAVERAAQSLSETAPLVRQPDVIERFFHHAVEALERLDNR